MPPIGEAILSQPNLLVLVNWQPRAHLGNMLVFNRFSRGYEVNYSWLVPTSAVLFYWQCTCAHFFPSYTRVVDWVGTSSAVTPNTRSRFGKLNP